MRNEKPYPKRSDQPSPATTNSSPSAFDSISRDASKAKLARPWNQGQAASLSRRSTRFGKL
jgi:hypothetical protein